MSESNHFIWGEEDAEGVTITHPDADSDSEYEDVASTIDRIDALLGDEAASFSDSLEPSPLYVQRKVLNAAEIIKWFKAQVVSDLMPADELHVTIAYSRTPVDWLAMGAPWEEEVTVVAGGPRIVTVLGDDSLVLCFASSSLKWRHDEFIREGASWDFPTYIPHITVAKAKGTALPEKLRAYTGAIRLGPEVFEELKDD